MPAEKEDKRLLHGEASATPELKVVPDELPSVIETSASPATSDAQTDPLIGALIGEKFKIESHLETNKFRALYQATDQSSGESVLVYVYEGDFQPTTREFHHFSVWMSQVATLSQEQIVKAHGFIDHTHAFAVTPNVNGQSLAQRVAENGPLHFLEAVPIFQNLCYQLFYWHNCQLSHENLQLKNIILADGDVKLMGFALVDLYTASSKPSQKQWIGQTDIQQLGMAMYHAITGKEPYDDWQKPVTALPKPLNETGGCSTGPIELQHIIFKAMHPLSARRYSSMLRFARALRHFLFDWQWFLSRRKVLFVSTTVGAIIGTASAILIHMPSYDQQRPAMIHMESSMHGTHPG